MGDWMGGGLRGDGGGPRPGHRAPMPAPELGPWYADCIYAGPPECAARRRRHVEALYLRVNPAAKSATSMRLTVSTLYV